ncbi:hypothetical protein PV08_11165 [Exophiala spinifera]|uniref:Uncharacterized protein n=1 Tax=Exophiala spinifera TaxID=91928 RepID=A0A0D2BFR0_9EURO|nr:uncharacterized protein PV08_11165 [Exophiala spinifera]KIW10204.1 hypothetical protein PV08_11165 [Exophiala spinifera]
MSPAMDWVQKHYWTWYEEAKVLLHEEGGGGIEDGKELMLDLLGRVDLGLLLRASVNFSLANASESIVDQVQYSTEALDLAAMLDEKYSDEETELVLQEVTMLVQSIKEKAEQQGVNVEDLKPQQDDTDILWEGYQELKAWRAAKEAPKETDTESASSSDGGDDTADEPQITPAVAASASDSE